MHIEIWSIGKANEPFIDPVIGHYLQKVRPWNPVDLHIIQPAKKSISTDVARNKLAEEELVLKRLQPHHYLILLDERGKMLDSKEWAGRFQACMNTGAKTLVLLIGGAYGVTDVVCGKARETWSLSKLVFPHQLVRLIVAEQVYRAFSILNNSPYHHL
jgi:23S rRNA (pseudouridine1915-N3)-methyltransferase